MEENELHNLERISFLLFPTYYLVMYYLFDVNGQNVGNYNNFRIN